MEGKHVAKCISIIGLEGFPLVKPGDDIACLIIEVAKKQKVLLENGDIVAISQKIVSKAENRLVDLKSLNPSIKAQELAHLSGKDARLIECVLNETKRLVKASKGIIISENNQNIVCLNAGIDKSNVFGNSCYSLLPINPDESAKKIRERLMKISKKKIAVIICDTYSRPFRRGQVEFAIGIAGIKPIKDYRGKFDLFKRILRFKYVAIADELASAAELVMGQGNEGIPVAIIRGLSEIEWDENSSSYELYISNEEDLFKDTL
jgi:coenzyme F420-0:L-glutamate ligase/coenzyme F420-1:gamma-L-glutamate ligase